jgi:hypothetical protein
MSAVPFYGQYHYQMSFSFHEFPSMHIHREPHSIVSAAKSEKKNLPQDIKHRMSPAALITELPITRQLILNLLTRSLSFFITLRIRIINIVIRCVGG